MSVNIQLTSFDDPIAQRLNAQVQLEYVRRYGGGDDTVIAAADFIPPHGGYYLAFDANGEAVASGAWRSHGDHDAEMKRLYVVDAARGRGHARAMVAHLEAEAAAAGRTRLILESGSSQPEALRLYESMGYLPVTPFGVYAGEEGAHHLGKALRRLADPHPTQPA